MNQLFYGDNVEVLRRYNDDGSVDLVYLDPPFHSNAARKTQRPGIGRTREAHGSIGEVRAADGSSVPNFATCHSGVDLLDEAGESIAQAWAEKGDHRTPSLEQRALIVRAGVPAPVT
jgi:hypothetical protein